MSGIHRRKFMKTTAAAATALTAGNAFTISLYAGSRKTRYAHVGTGSPAYSILTGVAANICFDTHREVKIADLVTGVG